MTAWIDTYFVTDRCVGCGQCADVCPVDAIDRTQLRVEGRAYINPETCIESGACEPVCPSRAILHIREAPIDMAESITETFGRFGLPFDVASWKTRRDACEVEAEAVDGQVPSISNQTGAPLELALYYPGYWSSNPEWMKNLLLFFDGICLLIPEREIPRVARKQEYLFEGLGSHNVLEVMVAEKVIDGIITKDLVEGFQRALETGLFDHGKKAGHAKISVAKMGYYADSEATYWMLKQLEKRGLVGSMGVMEGISLRESAYLTIVALLAHILAAKSPVSNAQLFPSTDQLSQAGVLRGVYRDITRGAGVRTPVGDIVSFDLENVGVDLSDVPLDEVLSFRREYGAQYRRYAARVREFALQVSLLPEDERGGAFRLRQEELEEEAKSLRRVSRQAWRRHTSFFFSIVAAAIPAAHGEIVLSLPGLIAALFSLERTDLSSRVTSYLFSAAKTFRTV